MYHDAPLEPVAPAPTATVHRHSLHTARGCAGGRYRSEEERIAAVYQLDRVVDFVVMYGLDTKDGGGAATGALKKVALQFPDNLLPDATAVVHALEKRLRAHRGYADYQRRIDTADTEGAAASGGDLSSSAAHGSGGGGASNRGGALTAAAATASAAVANPHAPRATRFCVLADNTFGSCCPDEITALHYGCDCIVHYGEACMSRATRLPVLYVPPPFPMSAVDSAGATGEPSDGEVGLVAAAVRRVCADLQRHADAHNESDARVQPHLIVVGTESTKELLARARVLLSAGAAGAPPDSSSGSCGCCPSVVLEWSTYSDSTPCACGTAPSSTVEGWTVNGAHFPRLPTAAEMKTSAAAAAAAAASGPAVAAASVAPSPLQLFLFVGSSLAMAPVHLHAIHQFNCFHYPPAAQRFFDAGASGPAPPVVLVLDEYFAAPEGGPAEADTAHRLAATASLLQAEEFLDGAIRRRAVAPTGSADSPLDLLTASAQSALAVRTSHRRLAQRSYNIEAVRASSAVAVLVASLAIDGYYECTMLLHQLLRAYGKRSYIVYVGHLNEYKLANFADTVDSFVVVACPNARHCHFPDRADNYMKPVVSPAEVVLALTATPPRDSEDDEAGGQEEQQQEETASSMTHGMAGLYSTQLECVLPPLRSALAARRAAVQSASKGIAGGDAQMQRQWDESAALIRMSSVGAGTLVAGSSTVQGSLERLHARAFVGLDPQLGRTAVQEEVVEGRHGIARGYATERARQDADAEQ